MLWLVFGGEFVGHQPGRFVWGGLGLKLANGWARCGPARRATHICPRRPRDQTPPPPKPTSRPFTCGTRQCAPPRPGLSHGPSGFGVWGRGRAVCEALVPDAAGCRDAAPKRLAQPWAPRFSNPLFPIPPPAPQGHLPPPRAPTRRPSATPPTSFHSWKIQGFMSAPRPTISAAGPPRAARSRAS